MGGCGGELTAKRYTDRVCHFSHNPGPEGTARECGRRARGVSSADHLYVKSAATTWLGTRGEHVDIDFAGTEGAPIGSVVDVISPRGALRVHLDQATPPVWDEEGREPVLGVSVPVDRETLIRRWYVHRIRLDSEGTSRLVRIGTEAFARPTEWFGLDECEMTDRGLSTPAVERIVRSRTTRPASTWPTKKAREAPAPQARARVLLRQLSDARKVESAVVVARVCDDIAALTGLDAPTREQLTAATQDAHSWLKQQAEVRRDHFARLKTAVAGGNTKDVRALLARINATDSSSWTEREHEIASAAADYLEAITTAATERVKSLLADIRWRRRGGASAAELRPLMAEVVQAAAHAGELGSYDTSQISAWKTRLGLNAAPVWRQIPSPSTSPKRKPQPRPLHTQVAQRYWIKRNCPRCQAQKGEKCVNDEGTGTGEVRRAPHDERVQPIIDERKVQQERNRPWRVYEVTCDDCGQGADSRCDTSGGPHRSRVDRAKEYTRLRKLRPGREEET
ncbi:hypothetical protein E1283_27630 [Streptomyces hainanensis]|uniref:DNA-binding phage zinc finger domain-containing protein n=1 Tax=Streptomyces hainanensis TaxID=402648 RepID=A0A4R4T1K9_9ACTN|nr:hypothetical protein E1283_27630 [Streptomyces hainanensis]